MRAGICEHGLFGNECAECLRARVAELERRIRAMLAAARNGSVLMPDGRDWHISELADLRRSLPPPKFKPLPKRSKR